MRYTCVMLTSFFENQPKDLDIHVYLLHSDLTSEDKIQLQQVVDFYGGTLHLIYIERSLFPERCPVSESWSLETYFRLALLDLLPEDVDRLLYLDVDIIVNQSLTELYFQDFEGNMVCACRDSWQGDIPDIRMEIFKEHLERGFTYFNAGVMLWNIAGMRGKYGLEGYLQVAEELDYCMLAPDQDLLNLVHWQEAKILDETRYNLFARLAYNHDIHYEEVKEQVAIVHFPGYKPWNGASLHFDIEELWWDYAKITPFYIEFMEEYLKDSIRNPYLFDTMRRMSDEKKMLTDELNKSVALCQKLYEMVQGNK